MSERHDHDWRGLGHEDRFCYACGVLWEAGWKLDSECPVRLRTEVDRLRAENQRLWEWRLRHETPVSDEDKELARQHVEELIASGKLDVSPVCPEKPDQNP